MKLLVDKFSVFHVDKFLVTCLTKRFEGEFTLEPIGENGICNLWWFSPVGLFDPYRRLDVIRGYADGFMDVYINR